MKIRTLLLFFCFYATLGFGQETALEIVKKSEEKLRGKSSQVEMEITIVRPTWTRSMSAKAWEKGKKNSMILITSPVRDKGTVFLKRDKEIWNYVPTVERNIKLPPSMMMQSWMGTDFNNDDLVRESSMVDDYKHNLIGSKIIDGTDCYKIEFIPKPEAAVVWGKIICFISKSDYLQLRAEFYDEDNVLINIMEGFDVKELGGRKLPSRMRMTPIDKKGYYTEIVYKSMSFDVALDDSFFTTQNMKRIH